MPYIDDTEELVMNKNYKLALRITEADRKKLASAAGPHGSVSSVVRMLIARFQYAEKVLKVTR